MRLNTWHTSSNNGGSCVEVMQTEEGFLVRDTKDSGSGPVLTFTHKEWKTFTNGVRNSEYDAETSAE